MQSASVSINISLFRAFMCFTGCWMVSVVKRRQDLGRWTDRLEDRLVQWLGQWATVSGGSAVCVLSVGYTAQHTSTQVHVSYQHYTESVIYRTVLCHRSLIHCSCWRLWWSDTHHHNHCIKRLILVGNPRMLEVANWRDIFFFKNVNS